MNKKIYLFFLNAILIINLANITTALGNGSAYHKHKHSHQCAGECVLPPPLAYYDAVVIEPGLQVRIVTNSEPDIMVHGQNDWAMMAIRNNTLFLSVNKKSKSKRPAMIPVTVSVPSLNNLKVAGGSVVFGDHIHGNRLTIVATGNSTVSFRGIINLFRLYQSGRSYVNIHWINSPDLGIEMVGESCAKLAGRVTDLHARLFGRASLDAKYLRTGNAFVQTQQDSVAALTVVQMLNSFARDTSNIYYYKRPRSADNDSREFGNVLELGHWR